ncbi:hypothetical protein ACFL6W_00690 [Thermodesulfobacteriota bacterium]
MSRNKHLLILFVISLLFFPSCGNKQSEGGPSKEEKSPGINELIERGPARVTLEIDKKEISIADRINLTISVDIEEDYEVEMPAFGDKLEQFGIVDYHNTQPELKDDNRKLVSRSYVLEPFLSGDYKITPMKISFFRKDEKVTNRHYLETPEIVIKVKSLLPEDIKDLELNEIIPPLPYPRSYKVWIWTGGGILLVSLLAAVFLFYRQRLNNRQSAEIRLKAHEIAYNELKALVDENLVEKGDIKQFYLRLSAIVRRYIENRFGLRAPEQTTEEFLSGLENASDFPAEYKPLLNNFLKYSDLVKFARFQPGNEDIQKSFDSCKAFIQGTEEQE